MLLCCMVYTRIRGITQYYVIIRTKANANISATNHGPYLAGSFYAMKKHNRYNIILNYVYRIITCTALQSAGTTHIFGETFVKSELGIGFGVSHV